MMKTILLPAAILGFCNAALADSADDVRCREIAFSQAAEARDAGRFASFIDADARFVGSVVVRGPDEILGAWAVFFDAEGPAIKWRPHVVEVLGDGTLALTRGPYRMLATDDVGEVSEHWGTFNSVWRLQDDGSWKVVFDAGSPAAAPPPEDVQALLDADASCAG